MQHVCIDGLKPNASHTHAPPPRSPNLGRRGLQQEWHYALQSSAATCLQRRAPRIRTRRQAPCLAHSANPAAVSTSAEQPKLAQQLCWRAVRRVAGAAACCTACFSLASSMQASAPFAAASLTFRSAAQTGSVPPGLPSVQSSAAAPWRHHNFTRIKFITLDTQDFVERLGVRPLALALASYTLSQGLTTSRCASMRSSWAAASWRHACSLRLRGPAHA